MAGRSVARPSASSSSRRPERYHRGLAKEGKLLFQGPFLDDSGALAVIEVETRVEAMAIVAGDPLVKNEVFKVELKHWLKAVERKPKK